MIKHYLKIFVLCAPLLIHHTYSFDIHTHYKDVPVLVTGGCGFIGSHLVEKLVELGAKVTILDNLSTGKPDNIAEVNGQVQLIYGDVTDFDLCLRATEGKEVIFHLAALTSVQESMQNPHHCFEVNITGLTNILEAARINRVERVIFSSSAAVYGNKENICSEYDDCKPTSPYGFSKLMGEHLCRFYAAQFGLKTICLRYFNVYGNRQNPHGSYAAVVPKFRDQMQHNLPLTIFGDGLQTRDFISVDMVARANLALACLEPSCLNGQPCNVATGKSINLLELIDILKKEFPNYHASIMHKEALSGDIRNSNADCVKLHSFLQSVGIKDCL